MKKATLLLLVLACLVAARPLELVPSTAPPTYAHAPAFTIQPVPLSQHEFYNDSGDSSSYTAWAGFEILIGKRFDGADYGVDACWITGYRVYYYGMGSATVVASFHEDTGGWPDDGPQLWTDSQAVTHSGFGWVDIPVDPPVFVDDAKFFGVFAWGSTADLGGPAVTFDPTTDDYQNYMGWAAGWYRYFLRAYVDDDVEPPYSDNQDPAPDDTNVPGDTDIVFDIVDDDAGVYGDSIAVFVDGADVTADCDIVDNGDGSFTVTYEPAEFGGGDNVEVAWEARDVLGNEGDDSWTFTIQGDWTVIETTWGSIKAR